MLQHECSRFLAAAVEYIWGEVLELGGNVARDGMQHQAQDAAAEEAMEEEEEEGEVVCRIELADIKAAIAADDELQALLERLDAPPVAEEDLKEVSRLHRSPHPVKLSLTRLGRSWMHGAAPRPTPLPTCTIFWGTKLEANSSLRHATSSQQRVVSPPAWLYRARKKRTILSACRIAGPCR